MKRIRSSRTRRNRDRSTTSPILVTLIGLALSAPFVVDMFVLRHGYAHITFLPFLEIIGIVFGGPVFLVGLVSFGNGSASGASTNDVDVARIRFAAEQEMNRKNK